MEQTPEPRPAPAVEKLAAAFAAAQGEFTNPKKSKTVHAGAKKYAFAPLDEILDAVRPVLAKHKLAVVQLVGDGALETRLLHESGQSIGSLYPLPRQLDSQAMGSAITYARRYSLCALLGIAAEDDDDATEAQAAEDAEEVARREEARKTLDEMKRQGKVRSAYDGKPLAPGQEPDPTAKPDPKPTPKAPTVSNAALAELMDKDGITPEQLKAYYVGKGHLPASVEPDKIPDDYANALVKNWKKAREAMKGAK